MKNRILLNLSFGILVLLFMISTGNAAQSMVALSGHVPAQLKTAVKIAPLDHEESIQLSLVVQVDQGLLTNVLDHLYGAQAPAQKHFLSSAEFAQAFGVADKRQKIKDFATAHGLTIDKTEDFDDSMVVKVSGKVAAVQEAFQIQLSQYRSATGQLFRAPETDPRIPASLAPHMSAVIGLSNLSGVWHPHLRQSKASALTSHVTTITGATGISGSGLSPSDIKTIYNLSGISLTGSGQKVALVEFDGYLPSDITHYEDAYGFSHMTITPVSVDGKANTVGSEVAEVTLDIELVNALAPGLSQMLIYEAPNSLVAGLDLYNKIATDNTAKVISTSWGLDEQDASSAIYVPESTIFQRMAAQGQTVFAAAGDCGAYDQVDSGNACVTSNGFRVDDPASQPFVTGVGGTSLTGSVSTPVETTWNEFAISNGGGGGGVSAVWGIPSWQSNATANGGSASNRNVPDIALNADPDTSPYSTYILGTWVSLGGTSAAAPLWAAYATLINQNRAALGNSSLGFFNPALYELGTSTSAASIFRDITTGNNGHYNAGTGYDNATGWGSFKGNGLINSTGSGNAASISNLLNVYVYPNPWDVRNPRYSGQKKVTFTNLPTNPTVKLFTLSGFWIKTLTPQNGQALWDLTNDAGQEVASGLYLYLVTGDGNTKVTGKIALIR